MFDAEVAEDGNTLLVVDGRHSGSEIPDSADVVMARREGSAFRRVAGPDPLRNVNTPALEYAPALSRDLKELFFTRLETKGAQPVMLRAVRAGVDESFGFPARLAAMTGFVEAPTLSGDGRSLYYRQREGERFVIMRVARAGLPAPVTH
jgi:hypothetical protein